MNFNCEICQNLLLSRFFSCLIAKAGGRTLTAFDNNKKRIHVGVSTFMIIYKFRISACLKRLQLDFNASFIPPEELLKWAGWRASFRRAACRVNLKRGEQCYQEHLQRYDRTGGREKSSGTKSREINRKEFRITRRGHRSLRDARHSTKLYLVLFS